LHVCGDALHYSELSFDVADGVMRPVSQGGVLLGGQGTRGVVSPSSSHPPETGKVG